MNYDNKKLSLHDSKHLVKIKPCKIVNNKITPPPTHTPPSTDLYNYLQAISEHFQCLYNNTADATDRWADFWAFVASQFGDMPSVIGYNYINEPWVGDFFSDPDLILPGRAGKI